MNLEQLLLGVVIALLAWTVKTVHDVSVQVAAISAAAAAEKGRSEDHETQILELRARVTALEIEVAKLLG